MGKLNVLIADDTLDIEILEEIILKSVLKDISNIYKSNFALAVDEGSAPKETETVIKLLDKVNNFDLALVDSIWEAEFGKESQEGGDFIINEIESRNFQNCKIIVVTKQTLGSKNYSVYQSSTGKLYPEIPKPWITSHKKWDNVLATLYKSLEEWQNKRIINELNQEQLTKLRDFLNQNKRYSGSFNVRGQYYFTNVKVNDKLFFNRDELIEILEKCLKFTHPRGIYNWANPNPHSGGAKPQYGEKIVKPKAIDLVNIYKLYFDLDKINGLEKTKEIDNCSSTLVHDYITAKDQLKHLEKIKIQEVRIYENNLCNITSVDADELKLYFNLLIWRRFIIGLNKLLVSPLNKFEIYDLYSSAEVGENSINKFFNYLGFKISGHYINQHCFLEKNCFLEENVWLSYLKL